VNIVLQKKNDSLKMIVMDNGEGFNAAAEYPGNGLKNMQSRAASMKASLKIDSIKNTGTTITLEVIIT
jgi:signal transduction histidine kinase